MKKLIIPILLIFISYSCSLDKKLSGEDQEPIISDDIAQLTIPADFNFLTTQDIELDISVKGLTGKALPGVKISIYTKNPDFGGKYLFSEFTNNFGNLNTKVKVPSYLENLFIQVHSVGFANQKNITISPYISTDFGGVPTVRQKIKKNKSSSTPIHISDNYYYMGTFNSGHQGGLPHYLEPQGDNLSQEFLDGVNASLPERKPVPYFNPQYLTESNELDIVVVEQSEVWVTFVAEGAGYRNSLGYYVFDSNNPPNNASEIDSVFIVLPNTSLANSGGELNAGDKVKLGLFDAGKTISWVLFQNAWSYNGVDVTKTKFYSRNDFNTAESDPDKMQHTVQLADYGRQHLLNGFEDQTRSAGSDNDFNDLIFYVTANPWEGIEIDEIPPVTPSDDTDEDGISDESDDFPTDPTRAIRNTYTGSVAFEDLWPSRGDYDFNDLVMDYEIDHILNGSNLLVDIEADWTIKAVFAGYKNGFGVYFDDLDESSISSISGITLTEDIITRNSNGTEANQSKASVIFFDNVFTAVQPSGSAFPHTSPVTTISSTINMNTPVSQSIVGFPPYNAFIFANGNRDTEIHLPGQEPTNLVNSLLFGTFADATNEGTGYFYKTSSGLPWAIHLPEPFDFPKESTPINQAYLYFSNWATSGGENNKDWYLDISGNRDPSKIY